MKPIVVIAAVPQETILLEHALGKTRRKKGTAYDFVEGELGKQRVIICAGGVGKINAAVATTALIEQFKPKLVINTGCAGTFPGNGLAIGELAVASEEILGDEGVLTSAGWQDLQFMNLPTWIHRSRRYYNSIPLSKLAAEKAMQMADHYGVKLVRGRFITISTCTGSQERAEVMATQYGAICESMEGGGCCPDMPALRDQLPGDPRHQQHRGRTRHSWLGYPAGRGSRATFRPQVPGGDGTPQAGEADQGGHWLNSGVPAFTKDR